MSSITQNPNSQLSTNNKHNKNNQVVKKPKRSKPMKNNTKQPLKVVYISNPMKIEASPLEFRSLVQELTGQDAPDQVDPTRICRVGGHDEIESNNTECHVSYANVYACDDDCLLPDLADIGGRINGSDLGCFVNDDQLGDKMLGMEDFNSFYS